MRARPLLASRKRCRQSEIGQQKSAYRAGQSLLRIELRHGLQQQRILSSRARYDVRDGRKVRHWRRFSGCIELQLGHAYGRSKRALRRHKATPGTNFSYVKTGQVSGSARELNRRPQARSHLGAGHVAMHQRSCIGLLGSLDYSTGRPDSKERFLDAVRDVERFRLPAALFNGHQRV